MGQTWIPVIPPPDENYPPPPFSIEAAKWSYVHGRCTLEEMEGAVELLLREERGERVGIPSHMAHCVLCVPGICNCAECGS